MNKNNFWKVLLSLAVVLLAGFHTQAQDFDDEDLKNYAMVMDSIEVFKSHVNDTVSGIVNTMIDENENFSASDYKDMEAAKGNEAKMKAMPAEKVAYYKEIKGNMKKVTKMKKEELNSAFSTLVKDQIGVTEYKAIKKALKEDEEVKAKYEKMMAEMKEARESGDDTDE